MSYTRHYGADLERVRQEALPDLTLTELQAAMAYYEEHRDEIDEILRDRHAAYERAPFPWRRTGPGTATDGKPRFDLTQLDPA